METTSPPRVEVAKFELSSQTQALFCKIGGRISFIHHNYEGPLPSPGEQWRVVVTSSVPSRHYPNDPSKGVYFVKPIARISPDGGHTVPAESYKGVIDAVAGSSEQAIACLAALRCGLVEPDVDALTVWLRDRQAQEARRKSCAAQRAAIARRLLRMYGFKILKEVVGGSGEYRFTTHQQYDAFWVALFEGEWLAVMTSPTTGYALSFDCAGWYTTAEVLDPLPVPLEKNWNPSETRRSILCGGETYEHQK